MVPTTATTSHSLSFLTIKTNTYVNLDLTLSPNTRCEMCITNFRCQPKSLGIIPDCNPTCQVWEQTVAWLSGASHQEWIITNNKIFVMAIFVCWLPYRKKTYLKTGPSLSYKNWAVLEFLIFGISLQYYNLSMPCHD
jgi:hypothetical protein